MNTEIKHNILYISYDGMTDPLGQSQVIPYLIGLTKLGFNFTLLSCEKRENFERNNAAIQQLLDFNNITWHPIFYTKRPPGLSTLYDYLQLKRIAESLHTKHSFKFTHCRSYISSLVGLWMSKKHGVPFIFDMRGFWADERVDGGLWNLNKPIFKFAYKFFKKKELEFLNQSAAIVSLTHAGKKEILKWKNLNFHPQKICVIPCCVDTDLFNPDNISADQRDELKSNLNIANNEVIIGYLGSIGTWYMIDEMMLFFHELKKTVTQAKFLFVTPNSKEEIYAKAIEHNISTTDVVVTRADRKDVPIMISLFNYGLFFIKPSYSKISSSPTKQGEIMAMGIPVICNSGVGDTDQIIENYNAGIIIKNNEFDEAIKAISLDLACNAFTTRSGAIDYFSLTNGVNKYFDIYNHI